MASFTVTTHLSSRSLRFFTPAATHGFGRPAAIRPRNWQAPVLSGSTVVQTTTGDMLHEGHKPAMFLISKAAGQFLPLRQESFLLRPSPLLHRANNSQNRSLAIRPQRIIVGEEGQRADA